MAAIQTSAVLTGTITEFWQKQLLMNAWENLYQNRWTTEGIIPQGNGKTYEWYGIDNLDAATTALTAGTTPPPSNSSDRTKSISLSWYGSYVAFSDELTYYAYHPVIQAHVKQLGYQAGITINDLTRSQQATDFTTVVRPGSHTADSTMTASDVMDYPTFSKAVTTLRRNSAQPVEGGNYACLMHPDVWNDFIQDDQVREVIQVIADSGGGNPYMTGYVGTINGCNIYQSPRALINTDAGSASVDTYSTFFYGREGAGTGGLAGFTSRLADSSNGQQPGGLTGKEVNPVQIIMKPLGYGEDPLNQRQTAGWKAPWAGVALNTTWVIVANTAASMGSN